MDPTLPESVLALPCPALGGFSWPGCAAWETGLTLDKLGSHNTWSSSKPLSNPCPPVAAYVVWPPVHNFFKNVKKWGSGSWFHKQSLVEKSVWTVSAFNLSGMHEVREEACVWPGETVETIQSRCPSHYSHGIVFYKRQDSLPPNGRKGLLRILSEILRSIVT